MGVVLNANKQPPRGSGAQARLNNAVGFGVASISAEVANVITVTLQLKDLKGVENLGRIALVQVVAISDLVGTLTTSTITWTAVTNGTLLDDHSVTAAGALFMTDSDGKLGIGADTAATQAVYLHLSSGDWSMVTDVLPFA